MTARLTPIVVAALVVSLVVAAPMPVAATGGGVCEDLPGVSLVGEAMEGSTPVVLVHGFSGSKASWFAPIDQAIDDDVQVRNRSFVEQLLRIDGVSVWIFDYHDTSARWVADPSIGPALAELLGCLAANGGQPAVLAVHSMGGLAARYAFSLLDDPQVVSGMVTFGTPNLGSDVAAWMSGALGVADVASMASNPLLGILWSFIRNDLDECAAARTTSVEGTDCGWVNGVPPLGSEAGIALQRGSTAITSLPPVPDNVSVLGIAGQIDVVFQESSWGFFYSDIGRVSVGDTTVMVDSATAQADEIDVRTCQLNLKTGYAISDDFRELAGLSYDDGKERGITALMSNPCQHSNLMHTVEFTNQALGFISAIAAQQKPFRFSDLAGAMFEDPLWESGFYTMGSGDYPTSEALIADRSLNGDQDGWDWLAISPLEPSIRVSGLREGQLLVEAWIEFYSGDVIPSAIVLYAHEGDSDPWSVQMVISDWDIHEAMQAVPAYVAATKDAAPVLGVHLESIDLAEVPHTFRAVVTVYDYFRDYEQVFSGSVTCAVDDAIICTLIP